jgi:hypothetical protein
MGYNFIVSPRVPITRCYISLWSCAESISSPGCDEGGEVSIVWVERDTMLSIPGIKYTLLFVVGIDLAWWNGD